MHISIKSVPSYPTSDGNSFADRKSAVEHEKNIVRLRNLEELTGSDHLSLEEIVAHSAEVIAALTVKESRNKVAA